MHLDGGHNGWSHENQGDIGGDASLGRTWQQALVDAEAGAMAQLDVPAFTFDPSTGAVDFDGEIFQDLFRTRPVDDVRRRLAILDDDRHAQTAMLSISLQGHRVGSVTTKPRHSPTETDTKPPASLSRLSTPLAVAEQIAESIVGQAMQTDGLTRWLTTSSMAGGALVGPTLTGGGLYQGSVVATMADDAALSERAAQIADALATEVARRNDANQVAHHGRLSMAHGSVGIAMVLRRAALPGSRADEVAVAVANFGHGGGEIDRLCCGSAGRLVALASLGDLSVSGSTRAHELASGLSLHLTTSWLDGQIVADTALDFIDPSLFRGAAGIAYALIKASSSDTVNLLRIDPA